jgi:hypothetical protein
MCGIVTFINLHFCRESYFCSRDYVFTFLSIPSGRSEKPVVASEHTVPSASPSAPQHCLCSAGSIMLLTSVVGLERDPLSRVSATEELLGRNSSGSSLEIRAYGLRDPSQWPRDNLYPQKLAISSSRSGGRSAGIVRSRTQATEFFASVEGSSNQPREHNWGAT